MSPAWGAVGLALLLGAGCHKRVPAVAISDKELIAELSYTEDPENHTLVTFWARPGARIPAEGIWQRYARLIGIPPESLVQVGRPRPLAIVPGTVMIDYQQMHLGYPVAGGYMIEVKDGLFLWGSGHAITNLPATLPTPISRERAQEIAFALIEPKGTRPWLTQPGRWQPPQQILFLWSPRIPPRGPDFQLVWRFSFSGTGLIEPGTIEIDAVTGAVMATTSGMIQ